jgi:hypothetical protein
MMRERGAIDDSPVRIIACRDPVIGVALGRRRSLARARGQ